MSPEQALPVIFPHSLPRAESQREQLRGWGLHTSTSRNSTEGQCKCGDGSGGRVLLSKCFSHLVPSGSLNPAGWGVGRQ